MKKHYVEVYENQPVKIFNTLTGLRPEKLRTIEFRDHRHMTWFKHTQTPLPNQFFVFKEKSVKL